MRIAYADPPYVGQGKRYEEKKEVNHPLLIAYLETFEGWALSCSSPSLQYILSLCSGDVRVGAWVKPFGIFKPNVNPAYTWEPLVFKPVRTGRRDIPTVRDWVSCNITLRKGLVGVKPPGFCDWLFNLLGLSNGDDFVDVFPGSGAVTEALKTWQGEN